MPKSRMATPSARNCLRAVHVRYLAGLVDLNGALRSRGAEVWLCGAYVRVPLSDTRCL